VDYNIPSIIGGYDREQSLIGGWYLAAHAMLEIPWGNWFWHAGVRLNTVGSIRTWCPYTEMICKT
jgi:hypothetical protein